MSHDSSASPVAEGEIIARKYRVARTLGAGGMGVVVAAVHIELNQRVALKFLLPQAAQHPELVERFAREARAAAQIQSEHVARVIDVGALDTGAPYMVMEYLDGEDLAQALTRSGPLPVEAVVGYVLQACEAIAEAHALGIVHRDLKPANLFLARRPNGSVVVKVLDFGISKSTLSPDESGLTQGATMIGSPSYMAPEQIKAAKSVDVRADQWSLGIILYELLAGVAPFKADSMPELVWQILDSPHAPLSTRRADVPPGLEAAIHRCLAKAPAARFADIAELAADIAPFGPAWSATSLERTSHVLGASPAHRATAVPARPPTPLPLASQPEPAAPGPVSELPPSTTLSAPPRERVAPPPPSTSPQAPVVTSAELPQSGASDPSPSSPTPAAHAMPADPALTDAPWSRSFAGAPLAPPAAPRAPGRPLAPAAIGVAAAFALIAALLLLRAATRTHATTLAVSAPVTSVEPPPSASVPPAATAPGASTVAAQPPAAVPAASTTPEPTSAPPISAVSRDAVRAAPRGDHGHERSLLPAPAARASAAPSATPRCSTVSYFDADGMKHFRQVCQ